MGIWRNSMDDAENNGGYSQLRRLAIHEQHFFHKNVS
jgi:hypothetical protein